LASSASDAEIRIRPVVGYAGARVEGCFGGAAASAHNDGVVVAWGDGERIDLGISATAAATATSSAVFEAAVAAASPALDLDAGDTGRARPGSIASECLGCQGLAPCFVDREAVAGDRYQSAA
jgi:hypothetical protein